MQWLTALCCPWKGQVLGPKITHVHQHDFIKGHFLGIGKNSALLGWLHSFFKQFYGSVTRSDYVSLRLGFIMTHFKGNPKFNFHKYMIHALEDDFKKVVGVCRLALGKSLVGENQFEVQFYGFHSLVLDVHVT